MSVEVMSAHNPFVMAADASANGQPRSDLSKLIWRLLVGESTAQGAEKRKQIGRAKAASNLTNAIHRAGRLEEVVHEFLQTYRQAARRAHLVKNTDFGNETTIHRLYNAMGEDSRRCLALMDEMSALIEHDTDVPHKVYSDRR